MGDVEERHEFLNNLRGELRTVVGLDLTGRSEPAKHLENGVRG